MRVRAKVRRGEAKGDVAREKGYSGEPVKVRFTRAGEVTLLNADCRSRTVLGCIEPADKARNRRADVVDGLRWADDERREAHGPCGTEDTRPGVFLALGLFSFGQRVVRHAYGYDVLIKNGPGQP